MPNAATQRLAGALAALAAIALVAATYKFVFTGVNATTVALSLLLVVLGAASRYGLGPGIVAATTGLVCFNFFFLPPVGRLTIADPQNWVALFAFLVTAVTASHLSSRARSRARDAERRREEVTKLYDLSRAIIATPESENAATLIAGQVVQVFGCGYCGVFLPAASNDWEQVAAASRISFTPSPAAIHRAYGSETVVSQGGEGSGPPVTAIYTPLKVGVRSIGVLVIAAGTPSSDSSEAIAGLVSLALERARFMREVSRTEALRQSDELKAALLASVSHDLRTPLTSIRAAVDNLLEENVKLAPLAVRELHVVIAEEVERLTRLVHNLLEMARIESGEMKPAAAWQSVPELVRNVLERCEPLLRRHHVTVRLNEPMAPVMLDARLLAQALANVVENAAKYSTAGSEIVVNAALEDDSLTVRVEDQGPGLSPDELERVFEKFYRGNSDDRRQEGTGMGLAIARGIVEAHGGRIWAENIPGAGAAFIVKIPVHFARDNNRSAALSSAAQKR
jgi:two-component system sensor histidine kinase KdpD